jgi:hypothetical protein
MKTGLIILFLIFSLTGKVFSQMEIYRTVKGDITFTISYQNSGVIAESHELIAKLDYDTGKLIFHVQYPTFHTGVDSIDEKLKRMIGQELKFDGSLDIFINPKKKTPQDYNMTGMMTSEGPPFPAEGNGTVLCMAPIASDDIPSCKLIATIRCKLTELKLTDIFINARNDIQVDILQSLLEREK